LELGATPDSFTSERTSVTNRKQKQFPSFTWSWVGNDAQTTRMCRERRPKVWTVVRKFGAQGEMLFDLAFL